MTLQNCIKSIQDENEYCLLCFSNYFQIQFYEKLKYQPMEFLKEECVLKISQKNIRKILIQNKECKTCLEFDEKYFKFATALEFESTIALRLKILTS